jgi:hypothetical protein
LAWKKEEIDGAHTIGMLECSKEIAQPRFHPFDPTIPNHYGQGWPDIQHCPRWRISVAEKSYIQAAR